MKKKREEAKIAVVGATGNVGREILSILSEKGFPRSNIQPLASANSIGREVSYGDSGLLTVKNLEDYSFNNTDFALFSAGSDVSKAHAPRAAGEGACVIDNTSYFRMDPDVSLVVPEVNPHALEKAHKSNIIANPNCSTIQLVMALKPLHDLARVKRVVLSTYQSVSGAGRDGMHELDHQSKASMISAPLNTKKFIKPIAFNVIPHCDVFLEDAQTKEEWKMSVETKKILDPDVLVAATCVRVPVFIGHSIAANIEFHKPITPAQARYALEKFNGVMVVDDPSCDKYITPYDVGGTDDVYVSRIRTDSTVSHGLSLWIVADNLRKGAALNAVQIAEAMIQ